MFDIAYYIQKDQVAIIQKNMDVGSGSDKIHKMATNKNAKRIYIVTNYGEERVVVAEISIGQLYIDKQSKWPYRVKGDNNSKIIDPPESFEKMFPNTPFTHSLICYV